MITAIFLLGVGVTGYGLIVEHFRYVAWQARLRLKRKDDYVVRKM